jgi:hypothetical protein
MSEFEVVDAQNGYIGNTEIVGGNTQVYWVHFDRILGRNVLSGVTAAVTSPLSTVQSAELSETRKSVSFSVTANTSYEVFTLNLQITDTSGQTLNFTIIYRVNAPVTETVTPNPLPSIIGPTGSTGPSGGPIGPTGSTGPNSGLTGPTGAGATGPTGPAGSGLSVTITTAKLTSLGSNGSMTFTNGLLTAQTAAT